MLLRNIISEFGWQTVPSVDGGIKGGRKIKGRALGNWQKFSGHCNVTLSCYFMGVSFYFTTRCVQNRRNGMDGCCGFFLAKIRGSPFPPLIFIKIGGGEILRPS